MKSTFLIICLCYLAGIGCAACENGPIPEVASEQGKKLTYDYVLKQYLDNGWHVVGTASPGTPDSFSSPEEALAALKRDIARHDSIWSSAGDLSRARTPIRMSYRTMKSGIFYYFNYEILDISFKTDNHNKIIDNRVVVGFKDISVGADLTYEVLDMKLEEVNYGYDFIVSVGGFKKSTLGGVVVSTIYETFHYGFEIVPKDGIAIPR